MVEAGHEAVGHRVLREEPHVGALEGMRRERAARRPAVEDQRVQRHVGEPETEPVEEADDKLDLSVPEGISIDDPVRMYLKEIGKVPLLTADEEIDIAKRLETGDEDAKLERHAGTGPGCLLRLGG